MIRHYVGLPVLLLSFLVLLPAGLLLRLAGLIQGKRSHYTIVDD